MTAVRQDKGFTLLELLSAFSLMLLIAVLLFDGLRFGSRVWAVSEKNLSHQEEVLLVRDLLENWLENAHPYYAPGQNNSLSFYGQRSRLEFMAPLGVTPGSEQIQRVILIYDIANKTLAANWGDNNFGQSRSRVILNEIEAFEFRYFGTREFEQDAKWHSTWVDREELPALIKIRFRFAGDREGFWPDLIINPKIDWGADCLFDPTAGVCRKGQS